MKLWLTLIFGTVLITALMTYLVMHEGGQILPEAGPTDDFSTPSKAEFGNGKLEANVLSLAGGDSRVDKQSTLTIPIKCTGDAPLKLELLQISCACVHALYFNGQKLDEKQAVTVKPGETGMLKINWIPKPEQANNPAYRFTARFGLNDPNYASALRMEVTTRILPKEGT